MRGAWWLTLLALLFPGSAQRPSEPIPVRYTEGVVHGFLVLRSLDDSLLARGDLLQHVTGSDTVETRMLFQFKDGSVFDETVRFTQARQFVMQHYRLIQQGPAFLKDAEFELDRGTSSYRTHTRNREDGKADSSQGALDLPDDTYNGMVMLIAKNFDKGARETVHYVAFTPQPRVIELEYTPLGEHKVAPADLPGSMIRYRIHPQLGTLLKVLSAVTGKTPPDMYASVIGETVPAFVRFEGPLQTGGPAWIIETTAPRTETVKNAKEP